MTKYKSPLFIILLLTLINIVSAAGDNSTILSVDRTGYILNDLLGLLSFIAVVFAVAIVIKIIMMMQGADG